jgi:tetratricopeptide (TPR) repeat protein
LNKSEFISLIDNPKALDKSHITALKNIASDFPYFQASHILLSKALFNENHYEFEKQLKSTALIVSDREVLYRFLHEIDVEEIIAEPIFANSVDEDISEIIDVFVDESIDENVLETELEEIPEVIEVVVEKPESVISSLPKNEKHSFTEWLLLDRSLIKEKHAENNTNDEEVDPENLKSNETPKSSSNVHEFETILDKFIRENPSISRPKAEFYNPSNMAKQSNEDDEDLATETLANIYYKQGAYKKAIRTYEKLCLIYPHKMSYFADLIQKIKQENKND